jgi:DNA-binding FadR family transcriptional regulator
MRRRERDFGDGAESSSVEVANFLKRKILELPVGSRLGVESEMLVKLGISRPTFREAARLLESQQLLTIRTGRNGGYYTRRPDMSSVAKALGTFFETEDVKIVDVMNGANALMTEAGRLAAMEADPSKRKRMRHAIERLRNSGDQDVDRYFAVLGEFMMTILDLANNPVVSLFTRLLHGKGHSAVTRAAFVDRPERIAQHCQSRVQLGEAILAGQPREAVRLSESIHELVRQWALEAIGGSHAPSTAIWGPAARS